MAAWMVTWENRSWRYPILQAIPASISSSFTFLGSCYVVSPDKGLGEATATHLDGLFNSAKERGMPGKGATGHNEYG